MLQGIARVSLGQVSQTLPHVEATWTAIAQAWPDTVEALGVRDAFRQRLTESADVLGGPESAQVLTGLPATVVADAVASGLEGIGP